MKWNKKTYKRELKKGYWDIEPHFYFYSLIKLFKYFRTFIENKMKNTDEVNSALYGEFVKEGKPILKGFYDNLNLIQKIVNEITKKYEPKNRLRKRKN